MCLGAALFFVLFSCLVGLAAVPGWEFRESTMIDEEFVRLTPPEPKKRGVFINKRPFFLSSVELTLEFKIHSETPKGGEGLALWLTDQPARSGSVFGGTSFVFFFIALYGWILNSNFGFFRSVEWSYGRHGLTRQR